MMRLEQTHDMELVKETLNHPSIWPYIHDDASNYANPVDIDNVYWLAVYNSESVYCGLFMLCKTNYITCEIHTCLLPEFRGEIALLAGKELINYAFTKIQCKKLISNVPSYNNAALKFALKCGLEIEGINKESFMLDGVIYDQTMVGITYKGWLLCQ